MSPLQPWHKDRSHLDRLGNWLLTAQAEEFSTRLQAEGHLPLRLIRTQADVRVFNRYPLDFFREWTAYQRWLAEIRAEAI